MHPPDTVLACGCRIVHAPASPGFPIRWCVLHGHAELAREVYDHVVNATETFEEEAGADLAYLLGAVLKGSCCEWPPDRDLVRLLQTLFPPNHRVWEFVRVVPESADQP